jgi:hypothetical protein
LRWQVAAAILAAAVAVLVGLIAGSSSGRLNGVDGELTFGGAGPAVPANFVGFSVEYGTLGGHLGLKGRPPNPLLARVWAPEGTGLMVRVGGNSADRAWPAGWPRPVKTVDYHVTSAWWRRLAAILRQSGSRVALNLNLAAGRPDAAAEMLRRAGARLPAGALAQVQIGNEPDFYELPRWRLSDGTRTSMRPAGYRFETFVGEARAELAALKGTGVPFELTGPGFAASWRADAGRFLAAGFGVTQYASHLYPLSNCNQRGVHLQAADLLRASTSARAVRSLAPELKAAKAAGVPLVVQEGNSVACRGKAGVSDHPYSALWAADQLFALLRAGVGGYFFHASNSSYDPYAFRWSDHGYQVHLAPEYVGLLLFQHASAPGARLLSVAGAPRDVAAWATRDRAGTVRVLLINRSTTQPVRLALPGRRARLLTVTTAGGLGLGGRPWPEWQDTADADLSRFERTIRSPAGRLTVGLPPAGAAVLTL